MFGWALPREVPFNSFRSCSKLIYLLFSYFIYLFHLIYIVYHLIIQSDVVNKISHFCSIIGGEVVNMENSYSRRTTGPDRTLNIIGVVWLKRKS